MADDNSPFEQVRKDLSKSIPGHDFQPLSDDDAGDEDEADEVEISHDIHSILPLLAELQVQDALPGIVFNYDRAACEKMCRVILKQLSEAETVWKETSPKWKEKLKAWEEWKKEVTKREKQGLRGEASKGMTKQDQMREAASVEVSAFASFDPNKPLDGFHFADNKKLSQEEFEVHAKELRYRGVDEWLIDGLRRGVGVHHAGMNRKYRYCVEMLFRKGTFWVLVWTLFAWLSAGVIGSLCIASQRSFNVTLCNCYAANLICALASSRSLFAAPTSCCTLLTKSTFRIFAGCYCHRYARFGNKHAL